jgi:hypothetical protein
MSSANAAVIVSANAGYGVTITAATTSLPTISSNRIKERFHHEFMSNIRLDHHRFKPIARELRNAILP